MTRVMQVKNKTNSWEKLKKLMFIDCQPFYYVSFVFRIGCTTEHKKKADRKVLKQDLLKKIK
jgi:hypothetical protein